MRVNVRPMNGRMATGAPASAQPQMGGVVFLSDKNMASTEPGSGSLILRVAFQAEVIVALHKHLGVDGAMGRMANRAAFAQRLMLVNERPALLAMALAASLVLARHGQPVGRLHDIHPMGIVALHTIHFAFRQRVMLWQIELGMRFHVATETSRRIFPRIHNEPPPPSSGLHMPAARSVTGFATRHLGHVGTFKMQPGMRAGSEDPGIVGMTLEAGLIANKSGAFHRRRRDYHPVQRRTRNKKTRGQRGQSDHDRQQQMRPRSQIQKMHFVSPEQTDYSIAAGTTTHARHFTKDRQAGSCS
ncbi:MAG: hypothetical protein JWM16_2854 [Verrucomicrobiales bacterium]|nr:hypothetical protein [Verrucomicrobiales bacterium]